MTSHENTAFSIQLITLEILDRKDERSQPHGGCQASKGKSAIYIKVNHAIRLQMIKYVFLRIYELYTVGMCMTLTFAFRKSQDQI